MKSDLPTRIREATKAAASAYHRLVLVAGPFHSGKTAVLQELAEQDGWPRTNVNLELSERLLEFTQRKRALRAARMLSDIVEETAADVVLLDNIEVLFSPELQQDPLRLLQSLSRNRTIVAAWPGVLDGEHLLYAEPNHPEHRRYPKPEAIIIPTVEVSSPSDGVAAGAGTHQV